MLNSKTFWLVVALHAVLGVAMFGAPPAHALMLDADVARTMSFGGSCVKCDFTGRKFTGANFVGSQFAKAILVSADLRGANIISSNFTGADFRGADLRSAEAFQSIFIKADFSGAKMDGLSAPAASFRDAALNGVMMRSAELTGANFRSADMNKAQLTGAQLDAADFTDVNAKGASFAKTELEAAQLAGHFESASFAHADLSGARLSGGSFAGADFSNAQLEGADLRGVDLSTARGLRQGQIEEACTDPATRLPGGLKTSNCRRGMSRELEISIAKVRDAARVEASETAVQARRQAMEAARQAIQLVRQMNENSWRNTPAPPPPAQAPGAKQLIAPSALAGRTVTRPPRLPSSAAVRSAARTGSTPRTKGKSAPPAGRARSCPAGSPWRRRR